MKNYYEQFSKEELEDLIDNPEQIETGCDRNCDECLNEELKQIKKALQLAS